MRPILLIALLTLAAGAAMASANDRSSNEPWEDPTCKEVWRAVIMTEVYPSFATEISLVDETGASRPFMRREISPTERREKRPFEMNWRTFERLDIEESSWDRFEPRVKNCRLIGTESGSTGSSKHWRMTWSDFPYTAEMDAWISTEHQLLNKINRRYLSQWKYPEERISITYTYNDLPWFSAFKEANSPEGEEPCAPIREMITRFNASPAIQMTRRVLNNGSGEPYLGQAITVRTLIYLRDSGWPWHLDSRVYAKPEDAKNCRLLGHQDINGVSTSAYEYERRENSGGELRIQTWISDENHLPIRAHFKRLTPDNGEEYYISYSYDSKIKEPY
jgi:hypothetical protein